MQCQCGPAPVGQRGHSRVYYSRARRSVRLPVFVYDMKLERSLTARAGMKSFLLQPAIRVISRTGNACQCHCQWQWVKLENLCHCDWHAQAPSYRINDGIPGTTGRLLVLTVHSESGYTQADSCAGTSTTTSSSRLKPSRACGRTRSPCSRASRQPLWSGPGGPWRCAAAGGPNLKSLDISVRTTGRSTRCASGCQCRC